MIDGAVVGMAVYVILSITRPLFPLIKAKPSSLYSPTKYLPNFFERSFRIYIDRLVRISLLRRNNPCIVTSNEELLFRLTQGFPLLKRKDLRACLIVVMCCLEIVVIVCAQEIALSRRSSVIEG
jgi:hypothetical protein